MPRATAYKANFEDPPNIAAKGLLDQRLRSEIAADVGTRTKMLNTIRYIDYGPESRSFQASTFDNKRLCWCDFDRSAFRDVLHTRQIARVSQE